MTERLPTLTPQMLEATFDPRADVFNRLLRDRVILLGAAVDDDIANQICAQLLYLEGEDLNRDIWLYINSPGGSVTAGMAIYDTMQFVACDVATVCLGFAASMGQFLLTAGAAGKRYSLPNARIMMHQPLAGLRGQATDIAIQAEAFTYTKTRMAELIAQHSGKSVDQIRTDFERDRWFTATQAQEYGLCDKVIVRRGDIHWSTSLLVRSHQPPATVVRRRPRPRLRGASGTIVATGPMSTAQLASSQSCTATADRSVAYARATARCTDAGSAGATVLAVS